jgi:hypothetical protein
MSIFLAPLAAGLVGLAILALPHTKRAHHLPGRLPLEPRSILSVLALYGASGNILDAAGVPVFAAAVVSVLPAVIAELFVMKPLFRAALGFEGRPSTPLECLAAEPARAVSEFRNGRGIVEAVRDGRAIQLVALLVENQRSLPVRVGERLKIVAVDADRQRVTVSLV